MHQIATAFLISRINSFFGDYPIIKTHPLSLTCTQEDTKLSQYICSYNSWLISFIILLIGVFFFFKSRKKLQQVIFEIISCMHQIQIFLACLVLTIIEDLLLALVLFVDTFLICVLLSPLGNHHLFSIYLLLQFDEYNSFLHVIGRKMLQEEKKRARLEEKKATQGKKQKR